MTAVEVPLKQCQEAPGKSPSTLSAYFLYIRGIGYILEGIFDILTYWLKNFQVEEFDINHYHYIEH